MFGVDNWGPNSIVRLGEAIATNRFADMRAERKGVEERLRERYDRLMGIFEQQRREADVIRLGDLVWLERGELRGKKAKLEPKVDGPYQVVGDMGDGAYQLVHSDGTPLKRLVNRGRLRRLR